MERINPILLHPRNPNQFHSLIGIARFVQSSSLYPLFPEFDDKSKKYQRGRLRELDLVSPNQGMEQWICVLKMIRAVTVPNYNPNLLVLGYRAADQDW
jgi:hypothetical protein